MARPVSNLPKRDLKLVAPVNESEKAVARELAINYFGGNEAEAIRVAVTLLNIALSGKPGNEQSDAVRRTIWHLSKMLDGTVLEK